MPKTEGGAPFSYDGLDRVIHEKARLGLLTSLMAHPKGLAFADLKQLCGLTDGNLSRHLQVLQEAGLVEVTKGYEGNRPHTTCRLTKSGRRRFLDYLALLEQVVRDAAGTSGVGAAGELFYSRRYVELDPYLFRGAPRGMMGRLSATTQLSVQAGAGAVPAFVIEDPQ